MRCFRLNKRKKILEKVNELKQNETIKSLQFDVLKIKIKMKKMNKKKIFFRNNNKTKQIKMKRKEKYLK